MNDAAQTRGDKRVRRVQFDFAKDLDGLVAQRAALFGVESASHTKKLLKRLGTVFFRDMAHSRTANRLRKLN